MSELRVNAKLDSWGRCSAICSADCCRIKIIVLHLQVHKLIPDHNSDKNTMFNVKYVLPKETIEPMSDVCLKYSLMQCVKMPNILFESYSI